MKNASLNRRLTTALVFTTTFTTIVVGVVFYFSTVFVINKQFSSKVEQTLMLLSDTFSPILWEIDRVTAVKIGQSALILDFISSLKISDHKGRTFLSIGTQGDSLNLIRKEEIFFKGSQIGELEVCFLKKTLFDYRKNIIWMSLSFWLILTVSVTLITNFLILKYFREPIVSLTKLAQSYQKRKENPNLKPSYFIEFRPIENVFKKMANEIMEQLKSVKESEEKYLDLYNNAPDMYVSVCAKTAKILECNQTISNELGYSKEEIIGRSVFDLYMPDSVKHAKNKVFPKFKKSGIVSVEEMQLKRKNGTVLNVSLNATAIRDENGNIISSRSIWRDITPQKRAEIEKEKLEKQLQNAQKMESIGNLAGGIAHDFNNILAAIIGFTELALDDTPKGTVAEDSLQEVYSAGKRATDLVQQILAFARQSDEKQKPLQPIKIAKEVLKFIRSTIPTNIEIQQEIESEALIMANATQLHQVLMNLCTNAAHAMQEKGGILAVRLKDVMIDKRDLPTGMRPGDYVEITVSDTGDGIPSEIFGSIFEPYFTTKASGEGTGMGLAMVHGIVESYGGKIAVDSKVGQGTTFKIHLPVTRKRNVLHQYEPQQVPKGTERVLFVDDEAPITKIGSQILERLGYSVTTRVSSIEALELFQAKPNDFDLVVTDMTMPNMTGDELTIELMKIRDDIPIILCTGYSKKISEVSASEIGIKAFAYKPIVRADLAKTVRKVLDEANTLRNEY